MRIAFKEWAVIVDALCRGDQIIILRKGGIHEGRGGFQVEHQRFWLFPTLFHQQREAVLPAAQRQYDEIMRPGTNGTNASVVRINAFAEVVDWRRLDSLERAERLRGQHVWRDEVIAQRVDWGREKNIHALAVRVYQLPATLSLPMLPAYGGCKSWIDLAQGIAPDGAAPVLNEAAFAERLERFRLALQPGPVAEVKA